MVAPRPVRQKTGPARRSRKLRPARSLNRLHDPLSFKAPTRLLPPESLELLPARMTKLPGGIRFPLKTNTFSRRAPRMELELGTKELTSRAGLPPLPPRTLQRSCLDPLLASKACQSLRCSFQSA